MKSGLKKGIKLCFRVDTQLLTYVNLPSKKKSVSKKVEVIVIIVLITIFIRNNSKDTLLKLYIDSMHVT